MPLIRVEQEHQKPFEMELQKDFFSIGRSSENDLSFNHLFLSRQHARILLQDGRYILEDVGSRNGTFLNGVRVGEACPLKPGDVIQLGEITLRFLDPRLERVQVTDATPGIVKPATYMIETDKIDFRRYTEMAKADAKPVQPQENVWAVLSQAGAALMMHYSIEDLVEVIIDVVLQIVPADRSALVLFDEKNPEELQIKAIRGVEANQSLSISRTVLQEVLKDRKAVLILDTQSDARFGAAKSIQIQGIRSIICVPLFHEKKVIGLIYLDNLASKRVFKQSDLQLIALIANMAAVKIENAQLMQEQLQKKQMEEQLVVASQIQLRLLPQFQPDIPGYQIMGMTQTCYQIGGDYYDFISKADKLAAVIADVSGKGVAAALLMAVFQATIRTLVRAEEDITVLMNSLNNIILDSSPSNKYITVFYGELNHRDHTFEYINAGHNPPILCKRDGHTLLPAHAPVIGVTPNVSYVSEKIRLDPGDLLFLYTDGITEAQNPKTEEFGEERLIEFLSSHQDYSVEDLSELLDNCIRKYADGAPLADDSTFVLLKRL